MKRRGSGATLGKLLTEGAWGYPPGPDTEGPGWGGPGACCLGGQGGLKGLSPLWVPHP